MRILEELARIPENAEHYIEEVDAADLVKTEAAPDRMGEFGGAGMPGPDGEDAVPRIFVRGESVSVMKALRARKKWSGEFQMIYADPPFFTNSRRTAQVKADGKQIRLYAYSDQNEMTSRVEDGFLRYLTKLTGQVLLMRNLLKEDGLLFLHLDGHAAHYMKVILDDIFGSDKFVNEIIWTYKSGGSTKKRFSRKHDTILVYSRSGKYKFRPLTEKSYNRGLKPYRFKGVQEYQDPFGWYTLVNMKDVWKIDMVGRTSSERTGYADQKPEELLRRIIRCSTDPGDLVGDFFSGSGTTAAVCAKEGRGFLACDGAPLAQSTAIGRLLKMGSRLEVFQASAGDPEASEETVPDFLADVDFSMTEDGTLFRIPYGRLTVRSVTENRLEERMERKSREIIEEILQRDPAAILSRWAVDLRYDGQVFRPSRLFTREEGKLELSFQAEAGEIPDQPGQVMVKVTDITGQSYFIRK